MIRVEHLTRRFGGLTAVKDVTLEFPTGAITGLIGPNGAGKSTLFNCIAGTLPPTSGRVLLEGDDITGMPAHQLYRRGVLRTFQIAHEFATLTVRDNLVVAGGDQPGESLWNACVAPRRGQARETQLRERANEVIDLLGMQSVAEELAGHLSGGQKKLLELGRTLMSDARIVFLDEVGAGVNRTLLRRIGEAIQRLNRERGLTFCLIEHDMAFVERLCDPVIVMAEGSILSQGSARQILSDERVIEAYLGGGIVATPPDSSSRSLAGSNRSAKGRVHGGARE